MKLKEQLIEIITDLGSGEYGYVNPKVKEAKELLDKLLEDEFDRAYSKGYYDGFEVGFGQR